MPVGFCSIPGENVNTAVCGLSRSGWWCFEQIASMNDSYGYTIVNLVWPHYSSSIAQLVGVFCNKLTADAGRRRIYLYISRTDHDPLCWSYFVSILTCRSEVLCRVCILLIHPRQHALEHAICVARIPQRELDHIDQGYICPEGASSCSGNR